MQSFRLFARALPRASIPRPAAMRTTARTLSALHRPGTASVLRSTSSGLSTLRAPAVQRLAKMAFGTSVVRLQEEEASEGTTDQELSATLASELQLERESMETNGLPAELQEFLTASEFDLKDTPGSEEVVLTKKFGHETITVTFSVADLSTEHDPDAFLQDRALEDESFEEPEALDSSHERKAINAGSSSQFATTSEDAVGAADPANPTPTPDASGAAEGDEAGFPVTMSVTISKPGQAGALHFGVAAHDGAVGIERVHFFRHAEQADAPTAEVQWSSRNAYTGPPFGNLDEGLQEVMERYLEERGINTQLALWVPEYIEWKEQREYMAWLEATREFVEA